MVVVVICAASLFSLVLAVVTDLLKYIQISRFVLYDWVAGVVGGLTVVGSLVVWCFALE